MSETSALRGEPAGELPSSRLHIRTPAAAVIAEFLREQDGVAPRTRRERMFGRSPLTDESRSLFWGVMGELEVGNALDHLGDEWTVLHSVPIGEEDADIDHVVIGPGGVFIVNTRNHSGQAVWVSGHTFLVSGQRVPHIRKSEIERGRVETLLSAAAGFDVDVTAVLAIVDPETLTIREKPRDVVVLSSSQLSRCFARRGRVLTPGQVEAISRAAGRERTWKQHPAVIGDTAEQARRFEAVRHEVFSARFVRQMWLLGSAVVLTGAIVLAAIAHLAALRAG